MPPHILVVDDEPEIAESLAEFLARKNYTVSQAITGREALTFLEQTDTPVDLVLLDMRMPELSGLEVLKELRTHPLPELNYIRVIMLTAATGNREKIEALNAGADDYITKPYQPQELLARVQTLLRSQQLEKQLQLQSQQLAQLNQVSNEVMGTVDLLQVLNAAGEGLGRVLGVPAVAIFTKQAGKNGLQCQYHSQPLSGRFIPFGQGLIGQTLEQAQPFLTNSPQQHPQFASSDAPLADPLTALLTTPILVRGNPWGVLVAFNKANGFTEFDLDLLNSLSTSISGAIENVYLIQNLQNRQQELLDSRNTLQAIMDGILHPIYTINDSWQLVAVNKNKADELKKPFRDLVGQVCYQAFFDRPEPCEHCQVGELLRNRQALSWSVRWKGADRLPREWDVNAYPVPNNKSGSATAVVVWQDRTEERRLEQSLLQAGKLAAIGQLAAGVAHEINNPLTAVNANAEMLKLVIPPEDDSYQSVDLIHRAGLRAAKVVSGLLDFAREQQYTFIPVDINLSIEQALDLVDYQLKVANVTVHKEFTPKLPRIAASSEHIKSVWINLLMNARDALRDSGTAEGQIEIVTRLAPTDDHVQVMIKDNGPGIPAATISHIFEPFYTTKAPGKGTGLGLATCLRIVQQHGGEIEILSPAGQGATFIVRLPTRFKPKATVVASPAV